MRPRDDGNCHLRQGLEREGKYKKTAMWGLSPVGGGLSFTGQMEVDGARIAFRVDGNPTGPAILFSHSLAADMSMWDRQVAALGARYRILRYDTRGHGASSVPDGDYTMAQLTGDAVAILDYLQVPAVHFVGLSLGGMVGQMLGAKHPDRVLSLTLCDTASDMPAGPWNERIETARSEGMCHLVAATLSRWFTLDGLRQRSDITSQALRMIQHTEAAGYIGCAAAIRDMALTPLLGEIRAPTLIIVGAEDPSTPVDVAQKLHKAIAGSTLVIIPDAAHLPNLEQSERFNSALSDFLEEGVKAYAYQ